MAQRTAVEPLAPVVARPTLPLSNLEKALQTSFSDARRPPAIPATPTQPAQRAWPQPVCLINSRIIVTLDLVRTDDIAKIDVYKKAVEPTPIKWRSLTEHGIIDITLKLGVKPRFKTKSLARIKRSLKLSGLVSFKLNGLPIEDESLLIADKAIAGFEVLHDDIETVVNIRLAPPEPTPPHKYPPGTVLIRGVAGM